MYLYKNEVVIVSVNINNISWTTVIVNLNKMKKHAIFLFDYFVYMENENV